jgi:hypothetical protein
VTEPEVTEPVEPGEPIITEPTVSAVVSNELDVTINGEPI